MKYPTNTEIGRHDWILEARKRAFKLKEPISATSLGLEPLGEYTRGMIIRNLFDEQYGR